MLKIYIIRKMILFGINIVIFNINNYNFVLFNFYVFMRENVFVLKYFSEQFDKFIRNFVFLRKLYVKVVQG